VAAVDVIVQFVEEVSLIGDASGTIIPEMVMRVADREIGF
jgi:hypothetical protein|tara:strand:- start:619 stop:738 length:120 start_codon:yes stop_codon:yes gene_type:complete